MRFVAGAVRALRGVAAAGEASRGQPFSGPFLLIHLSSFG
jgi:hypothetical protein